MLNKQKGETMKTLKIKLRNYLINNLAKQNVPVYFDSELVCTYDLFDECEYHFQNGQDC